jgi:polysaccharide export outer membrane protein
LLSEAALRRHVFSRTLRAMRYLALLALAACAGTLPHYDYATEPDPRNKELVLGVGDVVEINVWQEKDLNTEATIRPDGTITMKLAGDLHAAGQTPSMLRQKIVEGVQKLVKLQGSEVTVAVKSWRS